MLFFGWSFHFVLFAVLSIHISSAVAAEKIGNLSLMGISLY